MEPFYPETLVHSNDVWFEDGTVVLQAENTLFRVYRGILAKNSSFFRDIFSLAQLKEDEKKLYDGCLLLRVYDSPGELQYFLKALHEVQYSKHLCRTFESTVALLKLGTKYDVPFLREKAIDTLLAGFPTTLTAFDKGLPKEPFEFQVKHAFTVVNLARQLDVPQLLPAALYMASMTSISRILFGWEEGNGDRPIHYLSDVKDQFLCLSAREAIFASRQNYASFLQSSARNGKCTQPLKCEKERHHLHTETLSQMRDPLAFHYFWEEDIADSEFCLSCLDGMQPTPEQCRRKFWEDLPSFFNLPSWKVLFCTHNAT